MASFDHFVTSNVLYLLYVLPWCFYFLILALEVFFPAQAPGADRAARWPKNAAATLFLVGFYAVMPAVVVGVAAFAREHGVGLLNVWPAPIGVGLVITFLARSFVGYWSHLAYHKVPLLWRFHLCHHSDYFLDATTSGRFSFVEAFVGMVTNSIVVAVFGLSPALVLSFDVAWAFWNTLAHSNLELPAWLEKIANPVLHTPLAHRIHHSSSQEEFDSNYGIVLSIWDRAFGTYRGELVEPTRYKAGTKDLGKSESQALVPLLFTGFRSGRK